MTDAELRALVRDAVARHLGTAPPAQIQRPSSWSQHPSHHMYLQVVNATDACVIEPSVPCDHCGYCKSHGH